MNTPRLHGAALYSAERAPERQVSGRSRGTNNLTRSAAFERYIRLNILKLIGTAVAPTFTV